MKLTFKDKSPNHPVKKAYDLITSILGDPIITDAVTHGTFFHRLRYYWTNWASQKLMQQMMEIVRRDPDLDIQDMLDPGRVQGAGWDQPHLPAETSLRGRVLAADSSVLWGPGLRNRAIMGISRRQGGVMGLLL